MAALEAAGGAITRTTITVTAHESAIAAPMMGGDAASADAETETVGVHFDRLEPFQQHFVDNILKPFDLKNMVALFGFFQGNAEGADTATSQFNKQPKRTFSPVFEMFPHQLRRPGGHLKHAILCQIRLQLFIK